jgi:murein DD-endopeptidase MepM/ murein hydrolase activator NlpD
MKNSYCQKLWVLVLPLALFGCVSGKGGGESSSQKMVKVITKKDGNLTRFFVNNLEGGEVTATFTVAADNLKGNVNFPYTATYPAGQVTEAFSLTPVDASKGWGYSYTNHFTIGNFHAVHDDSCLYQLPYGAADGFRVTQGYDGSYSHSGPDQYAIDFKMPVGTPVHAARSGVVVKVKNDSDSGGPSRKYEACANYILIRHDDGTLANYAHLQKGGSRVKVGDKVQAGNLIALSGNTGFTSGAHLHFSVFKTRADGGGRESIPVKFSTTEASGITLVEGRTYRPLSPTGRVERDNLVLSSPKEDRKTLSAGAPPRN